jgi:hypothetical protein
MTSQEVASIYAQASHRWFRTALRERVRDKDRLLWKERFCARAVTLLMRWNGAYRKEVDAASSS